MRNQTVTEQCIQNSSFDVKMGKLVTDEGRNNENNLRTFKINNFRNSLEISLFKNKNNMNDLILRKLMFLRASQAGADCTLIYKASSGQAALLFRESLSQKIKVNEWIIQIRIK